MRDVDRAARSDHLELQCMLETECARYAARRRTDEDLATLRKLLKARGEREASRDVKKFVERDRAFHIAVAAASHHNHALEALYRYFSKPILANVEDILVELDEAEIPEPDMRAHQAVLDAIEQRDENKAVRATLAILKPQMACSKPARRPPPDAPVAPGVRYAATPSITSICPSGAARTPAGRQPAAPSSASYSSRVRSRPLPQHIMWMS